MKVVFITAIFGSYEASTKPFVPQRTKGASQVDFICFTDSPLTINNAAGWIIDSTPYHMTHQAQVYHPSKHNSIENNKHTFNIAKYYKQSFHNIPRLAKYDIVIWLDGTVQITSPLVVQTVVDIFERHTDRKIITWQHEGRIESGLAEEVQASIPCGRYCVTHWFGQNQPFQDVVAQYQTYIAEGYKDVGVWCTCFVAFDMSDRDRAHAFLDMWYDQTLSFTTQDQIGFPYCVFKLNHFPYTLPDENIKGAAHECTDFYIKRPHHQ